MRETYKLCRDVGPQHRRTTGLSVSLFCLINLNGMLMIMHLQKVRPICISIYSLRTNLGNPLIAGDIVTRYYTYLLL